MTDIVNEQELRDIYYDPSEGYKSAEKLYLFIYLNTLLDKYIPKGRSANGTRGPMQGTPPIRHITHKTYK